jgi:hypothetical protein
MGIAQANDLTLLVGGGGARDEHLLTHAHGPGIADQGLPRDTATENFALHGASFLCV